jgi:magnesium transporter
MLTGGSSHRFSALELFPDGALNSKKFTVADILSFSDLPPRDLISLNLRESYQGNVAEPIALFPRTPAAIIPRVSAAIITLGHIKAVLRADRAVFFDTDLGPVASSVQKVARFVQTPSSDHSNVIPFELKALEGILRVVSKRYARRALLYRIAVDRSLKDINDEIVVSHQHLQTLVPLRDSLSNFEMQIDEMLGVIKDLVFNEQDLLDLLLSEKSKSKTALPIELHQPVELLFESYYRRLWVTKQEIVYLGKRVMSRQEMASIHLDVYRNKVIRLNLQLTVATLSTGFCAVIAGMFGMNLKNGFEDSEVGFYALSTFSIFWGLYFYMRIARYLKRAVESPPGLSMESLRNVLQNFSLIEHVIWSASNPQLDKSSFRKTLVSTTQRDMTDSEISALFDILDLNEDGIISREEFSDHDKELQNEAMAAKNLGSST